MTEKSSENKTKADEVHVSDGLAELHEVAEELTEEEVQKIADRARKAAEDAKNSPQR